MAFKKLLIVGSLAAGVAALFAFSSGGRPAAKGKVTLFISTDCPVSAKSVPSLKKLMSQYEPKGFEFTACFSNAMETTPLVDQYLEDYGLKLDYCIDIGGAIAKTEGVTHVPTVIVNDAKGKKVYQGAIFDNRDPSKAGKNYLQQVLSNLDNGKTLKFAKTSTFGCILMPGDAPPALEDVTYAKHVAPILNAHCVECHRPGEVAPFSLVGYENAKKWAPNIAFYTGNRTMPPWKAVPGFGDIDGGNTLTEMQIEILKRWANGGAQRGDAKLEPQLPEFNSEWSPRKPELILSSKEPYRVEAEGADEYRHFVYDPGIKETVYVTGMSVKPGNAKVVHHVIAFLDELGLSKAPVAANKDGKEGYATPGGGVGFLPTGSLGGWAPGSRGGLLPEGTAFELKPGTKIVLQVHYHKTGKVEMDQTRLGLFLSKKEPKKVMGLAWCLNPGLRIKAGDPASKMVTDFPIPADVTLYGVMPHMHLLGKSMKAEIVKPDGERVPLVWVKDWDFNWQLTYMFRQPVKAPKGSKLHLEAIYDNSENNPNNPHHPPIDVRWGEETTDEMFLLVVPYTVDNARAPKLQMVGFGGG